MSVSGEDFLQRLPLRWRPTTDRATAPTEAWRASQGVRGRRRAAEGDGKGSKRAARAVAAQTCAQKAQFIDRLRREWCTKSGRLEHGGRLPECGISICMVLFGDEWRGGDGGIGRGLYAGARFGRFRWIARGKRHGLRQNSQSLQNLPPCNRNQILPPPPPPKRMLFPVHWTRAGSSCCGEDRDGGGYVAA